MRRRTVVLLALAGAAGVVWAVSRISFAPTRTAEESRRADLSFLCGRILDARTQVVAFNGIGDARVLLDERRKTICASHLMGIAEKFVLSEVSPEPKDDPPPLLAPTLGLNLYYDAGPISVNEQLAIPDAQVLFYYPALPNGTLSITIGTRLYYCSAANPLTRWVEGELRAAQKRR